MDKRSGIVDANHFRHPTGEFKGGTPDGTSKIQGSVGFVGDLRKQETGAGRRKIFDPLGNRDALGEQGGGFQIVKSEVLRQNGGFFVEGAFQARSFWRYGAGR